jgi:hypothetical protein
LENKIEESLSNRGNLRASFAASVFGRQAQVPVTAASASPTEQAKIAESMERYAGKFDDILAELRGESRPIVATAAADSGLPAWKRPRKKARE